MLHAGIRIVGLEPRCWQRLPVALVCGDVPTLDNPLTLGHRRARTNGGTLEPSNLQAECRRCNLSHGALDRRPGENRSMISAPRHSATSKLESLTWLFS